MKSRVIGVYNSDLDELLQHYLLNEALIEIWKKKHEEYIIELKVEIDDDEVYTLSMECRKR
jgi:hypothetical protein